MRKVAKILLALIVFFGIVSGIYFSVNLSPVTSKESSATQIFTINKGEGLNQIGSRLKRNGIIRSKNIFIVYSYYLGLNKKLQAGSFQLSPSSSTPEIISQLSKGGRHEYWLKIIDGTRIEEIAGQFPDNVPFSPKEFILKAKDQEGFLFPDSYLIPTDFTIEEILKKVNNNFESKVNEARANASNSSLSQDQIIILASLLEREAKTLEDKIIVAGILQNRLDINMALQVDAAVQYAKDSKSPKPDQYWQPISGQDTRTIDSPYNTYKYPGLPPGPICNPGYNSIYAAYHPAKTEYMYYITGKDGRMHYAKTLEEHNQNIGAYL
ncbi:MAG: endolytic transglycosylase MltG [Patescibacteria group bacterium]|jgi:UPF0755 protein